MPERAGEWLIGQVWGVIRWASRVLALSGSGAGCGT
jgi:hypothetical protein